MDKHIKEFVNDRYLSFNIPDLIFRILGYFAYNFIMIFPTEFILTDVQQNGFVYISLTADYARPLVIGAIILAVIMGIVTVIVYLYKTKWSVIVIRGISFAYISFSLLVLSCFSDFHASVLDIVTVIMKILVYCGCFPLYVNYLFKKKLPNFNPRENNRATGMPYVYLASLLVVISKPLLGLFFNNSQISISIEFIITGCEYLIAVGVIINTVDLFTKAYYSKKYSL